MSEVHEKTWYEANQAHLAAALAELRTEIETAISQDDRSTKNERHPSPLQETAGDAKDWAYTHPPAIQHICALFELSGFERKVLLMCAGAEMDAHFPVLYAAAHNDTQRTQPTFGLALSIFPEAHWSALTPAAPLRRWNLVELDAGETLATRTLRLQESVLHYLAGLNCLDERLQPLMHAVPEPDQLAPSHLAIAEQIVASWSGSTAESGMPIVQLCGSATASKREIAAIVCARIRMRLHVLDASCLPLVAGEIETLIRLWERDALIGSRALLLECDEFKTETHLEPTIARLMESIRGPLIVSTRSAYRSPWRSVLLFDVEKPTRQEQTNLWKSALPASFSPLNGKLDTIVTQFNLSPSAIQSSTLQALGSLRQEPVGDWEPSIWDATATRLWNACRVQARPSLEGLAQRIESTATWDDLVLPAAQKQLLGQIGAHVRQCAKVYHAWGFGDKGSRGLGISALFAGASGTGKTMAAEVLSNELHLDLYRLDLSQVISKYIGETEKNLRRIFEAAEEGAAILLFDEADALFGKRSEVKDSHDRYANIEVSYLLQRMEAYRGLAILTTNRKSALDQAFLRRLRFVVEFPFPEAAQRAEIWKRVFPPATPTDGLKVERLARLNASGGHIRNIALGAAFLAADAGEPVRMSHLLHAARNEFTKMEKPLPDMEVSGWV